MNNLISVCIYYTSAMSSTSPNGAIFDDFGVFLLALVSRLPKTQQKCFLGDQFEASGAQKPSKVTPGRS